MQVNPTIYGLQLPWWIDGEGPDTTDEPPDPCQRADEIRPAAGPASAHPADSLDAARARHPSNRR